MWGELLAAIRHLDARHMADLDDIAAWLAQQLAPGDVLLTLGRRRRKPGRGAGAGAPVETRETVTDYGAFRRALAARGDGDRLLQDEPLARHTSFGIGGPADLMLIAQQVDELVAWVQLAQAHEVPVMVLGQGYQRPGGRRRRAWPGDHQWLP